VLLISLGAIAWEAIQRLGSQGEVAGKTVIMVAAIGVLINGFTAFLFASGRKGDLNIRGAFLHFAADALVSLAVVLAGIVILYAGWSIVDPLLTLGIVAVIFWGTWGLLRDSLNLALDAVPEGIDPASVQDCLSGFQNVVGVHDLHVWGMSTTEAALTAHLVVSEPVCNNEYLKRIESEIHSKFGIEHVTVQIEVDDGVNGCRCRLENDAIS